MRNRLFTHTPAAAFASVHNDGPTRSPVPRVIPLAVGLVLPLMTGPLMAQPHACCKPHGVCQVLTADQCWSEGGWPADAPDCDPNICAGPCCFADGSCAVMGGDDCEAAGGTHTAGQGYTCETAYCPKPPEACCDRNGGCQMAEPLWCTNTIQGIPGGPGSTCTPNPCSQPQACCNYWNGQCFGTWAPEFCEMYYPDNEPAGPGTNCSSSPNPCLTACCWGTYCEMLTEGGCEYYGGTWLGPRSNCEGTNQCPPKGTCCHPDGTCEETTDSQCDAPNTWTSGATCSPTNPCPQPCTPPDCDDANPCTEDSCDPETGECEHVDPGSPAACCREGLPCEMLSPCECQRQLGQSMSSPTGCTPDPCPQPEEACCLRPPSCSCEMATHDDCTAGNGVPQGTGSVCESVPCEEYPCCLPDGNCAMRTRDQCDVEGGQQYCADGGCVEGLCPGPDGACCDLDGECCVTKKADCTGNWTANTACTPNPCPQPECDSDPDCDDGDPCTNDVCTDRQCTHPWKCDDGDHCTDDACDLYTGECTHPPTVCDDDNPCTEDACDPAAGCWTATKPNGTACDDDGSPCTDDVCSDGQCTHPWKCDDGNYCTDDYCDLYTGECTHPPTVCDDGNQCTEDACDPTAGCWTATKPNGTACDDHNSCTANDTCLNGQCQGENPCEDGLYCTEDFCFPTEDGGYVCRRLPRACPGGYECTAWHCDEDLDECISEFVPDGTPCYMPDDNPCTDDVCVGGECQHPNKPDGEPCPSDDNMCTNDLCFEGECQHWNKPDGYPCDDGNECTEGDDCLLGICRGYPKDCSDNDACTTNEHCDPATGECVSDPRSCDDGNPCTDDHCSPSTGCYSTDKPNGTSCTDDNNMCTNDICFAGECQHWDKPDGYPCDDGNKCTERDDCLLGICAGYPKDCSDDDPCTTNEHCNPETGECDWDLLPRDSGCCNDASPCDRAIYGPRGCVHYPRCRAPSGCFDVECVDGHCEYTVNNSYACSDGDDCTDDDHCANGTCVGTPIPDCTPSPPPPPPKPTSGASRKNHGSAGPLDINLMPPQNPSRLMASGSTGLVVEDRQGGLSEVHIWFDRPISGVGGLDPSDVLVVDSDWNPIGLTTVAVNRDDPTELLIELAVPANAAQLRILFTGIQDDRGQVCRDSLTIGVLVGDVEGTGLVDESSVAAVQAHIGEPVTQENCVYDVDMSGTIDGNDVAVVQAMLGNELPPLTGRFDFNSDGHVDADDLDILQGCSTGPGISGPPASGCTTVQFVRADWDRDRDVDQTDFSIFQRCYSGEDHPADPNCAD